jgi:predicted amidohydrolase
VASKFQSFLYPEQAPNRHLKVASFALSCDREPESNLNRIAQKIDDLMQTHPGVELVLLGEMILGWYNPGGMPEYHRQIAQPVSQTTLQTFTSLARRHGIYLCLGMSELDDRKLYNTQVLINPQGRIQAVHRKWNLKLAEREAGYQPGAFPLTIMDIKGIKTGIAICSDLASPRTIWEAMRSRLDLILLSLTDDRDQDRFMAKFNAHLYDAWIVTANRYGDEGSRFWNGHLVVSDPLGHLRLTGQDGERTLIYDLSFADKGYWLKRTVRNIWVKTPLVFHILKNWKRAKSYL